MKAVNTLLMSLAMLAGSTYAVADDLLVTSAKAGAITSVALDVATGGESVALEMNITIPAGAKVDLTSCVAQLPKSHGGVCNYVNGKVILLVFSDSNEPLPAGVVSIGTVKIVGGDASGISVTKFEAFNRDAVSLATSVKTIAAN